MNLENTALWPLDGADDHRKYLLTISPTSGTMQYFPFSLLCMNMSWIENSLTTFNFPCSPEQMYMQFHRAKGFANFFLFFIEAPLIVVYIVHQKCALCMHYIQANHIVTVILCAVVKFDEVHNLYGNDK